MKAIPIEQTAAARVDVASRCRRHVSCFAGSVMYFARMGFWVALAVALLTSPASAARLFYADELEIVDATGKELGTVAANQLEHPHLAYVTFRWAKSPVFVKVNRGEFVVHWLYFRSGDCTGQAFIDSQATPPSGYPVSVVIAPRMTVYVQAGEFRDRVVGSRLFNGVCARAEGTESLAPAKSTEIDLMDHFTPPFRARPRGATEIAP